MKLNIGCYTVMFNGWVNIDVLDLHRYAHEKGYDFFRYDMAWGLPFNNEIVDYIFCSHSLEHITYNEGQYFLSHCHRVLKPGGVMRIAVPDVDLLTRRYQEKQFLEIDANNVDTKATPHFAQKFWNILTSGHKAGYDHEFLEHVCTNLGFKYERSSFQRGSEIFKRECQDMFPEVSLYAEITKV